MEISTHIEEYIEVFTPDAQMALQIDYKPTTVLPVQKNVTRQLLC